MSLQNYAFEEQIGFGSFSSVYRAINLSSSERVAIKVVKPEVRNCAASDEGDYHLAGYDLESLRREIKLWSSLDHKNLSKLIDVDMGRLEDVINEDFNDQLPVQIAFIMEYAEGGDLMSFLSSPSNHSLPPFIIKKYFIQLVEAVNYLHSNGLVHGDIKLENILLTSDHDDHGHDSLVFNRIILTDFGLTRPVKMWTPIKCGTLEYSAPELLMFCNGNERNNVIDPIKTDIWALGIVLYGMIYRRLPFDGPTPKSIKTRILTSQPKYKYINEEDEFEYSHLIELCKMLLQKNANERTNLKGILKFLSDSSEGDSDNFILNKTNF